MLMTEISSILKGGLKQRVGLSKGLYGKYFLNKSFRQPIKHYWYYSKKNSKTLNVLKINELKKCSKFLHN